MRRPQSAARDPAIEPKISADHGPPQQAVQHPDGRRLAGAVFPLARRRWRPWVHQIQVIHHQFGRRIALSGWPRFDDRFHQRSPCVAGAVDSGKLFLDKGDESPPAPRRWAAASCNAVGCGRYQFLTPGSAPGRRVLRHFHAGGPRREATTPMRSNS